MKESYKKYLARRRGFMNFPLRSRAVKAMLRSGKIMKVEVLPGKWVKVAGQKATPSSNETNNKK